MGARRPDPGQPRGARHVETLDCGKPIAEARLDIVGTADILEYYAGLATKIFGQTMPLPGKQIGMVLREPCGVVGQITPWNFPLYRRGLEVRAGAVLRQLGGAEAVAS